MKIWFQYFFSQHDQRWLTGIGTALLHHLFEDHESLSWEEMGAWHRVLWSSFSFYETLTELKNFILILPPLFFGVFFVCLFCWCFLLTKDLNTWLLFECGEVSISFTWERQHILLEQNWGHHFVRNVYIISVGLIPTHALAILLTWDT